MYLGLNYGFIFPASYVTYDLANHSLLIEQINTIHFITMILSAIALLFCMCFARSAPPTPPAPVNDAQKNDITKSFKYIFSKLSYVLDLASISVCILGFQYISRWNQLELHHYYLAFIGSVQLFLGRI